MTTRLHLPAEQHPNKFCFIAVHTQPRTQNPHQNRAGKHKLAIVAKRFKGLIRKKKQSPVISPGIIVESLWRKTIKNETSKTFSCGPSLSHIKAIGINLKS